MLVQNGREEAESAHGGCLSRVAPLLGVADPQRS